MTTINSELELYSLKGNTSGGKILLFSLLENKNYSMDEIKELVVDTYEIMRPKHFVRSWKEYTKTKRFLRIGADND